MRITSFPYGFTFQIHKERIKVYTIENMRMDKYPFIRILIPLSTGITFGYFTAKNQVEIPLLSGIMLCVVAMLGLGIHILFRSFSFRWIPGVSFSLIFFSMGGFIAQYEYTISAFQWPDTPQYYEIILLSSPKNQTRSVSIEGFLKGYYIATDQKIQEAVPINKKIIVYLPRNKQTENLKKGEIICIYSIISTPQNKGNPEEFDYRNFLLRKGISGVTYANKWKLTGIVRHSKNLFYYAETARLRLLSIYEEAGIQEEQFGILAALTLGYKEKLTEETKQSFSQAGISHVLALSGLHVGIIYLLLNYILNGLFRKRYQITKGLILIVLLWIFAFLTGLMPPVIRATIMGSLLILAKIRSQESLSVNTLGAAAFFMLCFRPLWLFEPSFQLSFTAVTGILLWQKWFFNLVGTNQRIIRYIWSIISVSFSAQLAVLPLVLYYFSSFPCYFIVTNVAVLGLITIIIYSGLLLILLFPFQIITSFWSEIVQKEIQVLTSVTQWVGELPGSQISNIYLHWWEVWIVAALIYTGMYVIVFKKSHSMYLGILLCLLCIIVWGTLYNRWDNRTHFPSMVFYNSYNCPALHLISSRQKSYLWTDTTLNHFSTFLKNTSSFRNKIGLANSTIIQNEWMNKQPYQDSISIDSLGIIQFQSKTICHINDQRWRAKSSSNPLAIDYLWISKGFTGSLTSLQSLFCIKEVIIDASVPEFIHKRLEEECIASGLNYKVIRLQGAYIIPL